MSRFTDAMNIANEALLNATGDTVEYWPGGVEDDALEITAIWTGQIRGDRDDARAGRSEYNEAEVQIWADDVRGVAEPDLRLDKILHAGAEWRVMAILESVAGMHRLSVERVARSIVGRGRGAR